MPKGPTAAIRYPTDWVKPDSAAVPSLVRARRAIRVRTSGKMLAPIPTSTAQSHAPPVGASIRPMYPAG
jgi:hypothetical protein